MKQTAEEHVKKQDYQAAIGLYEKILEENPQDIESKKELARLYGIVQQYDRAVASYDALLKEFPDDFDILFSKAQILSWKGDLAASEKLYKEIVHGSPNYTDAKIGLSRVLLWQQKFSEARSLLKNLIDSEPDNITALELLVQVEYDSGNIKEARTCNNRLLQLIPDSEAGIRFRPLLTMYTLELGSIHDSVTDRDNWLANSIAFSYKKKKNLTGVFGYSSFSRYGMRDQQLSLSIYASLLRNLNVNGLVSAGIDKNFLPRQRLNLEISYAFASTVISAGVHLMKFPVEDVNVGVLGFEYYFPGNIYTDYKYYHSEGELNNSSNTHLFRFHFLKENKYHFSAGIASGGEAFQYASEDELFITESKSYLSNILYYISNSLGFRAAFSYTDRKDSYKRTSIGIGLLYRF
ncbi:YaiO family outer membrane beta-barrel protein [candidate division KSB1 bacterium]